MKILTCNIRCSSAKDGENGWLHRRDFCSEVILAQDADVICFQEMLNDQFEFLAPKLNGYDFYALIDHPHGANPTNAIFYRRSMFKTITASGYWLSETPHIAGTRSWESACVRLANWIRLEEISSSKQIRIINTHLDHVSQPAREEQASLIVEDSKSYREDFPQILTGDMNSDSTNKAIDIFRKGGWKDTYNAVHHTEEPGITFHAFEGENHKSAFGRIDWIFIRGNLQITDASIIKNSDGNKYPSDHYFVSATVM